MNCQDLKLSPDKSEERINSALRVFQSKILFRIVAFALYLLGAPLKAVADLIHVPDDSLKTMLRVVLRDGFAALQDRRFADTPFVPIPPAAPAPVQISIHRDDKWLIVRLGMDEDVLRIPIAHKVQARAILLSLFNSGHLSARECAPFLEISESRCRELASKLTTEDVEAALIDKRQGQTKDYKVGKLEKAEIIRQFAARVVTKRSATSEELAKQVNELTGADLSPRTVRWYMEKYGLYSIKKTLPKLVETLKKTPERA